MKLYELIKNIAETDLPDVEITDISSDTRKPLGESTMFVCVRGATFDGHDKAEQMLENGAAVVVAEHDLGLERQIVVSDTRKFLARVWAAWFGHPERSLRLVGVTGTNGKTTTTTVIKYLLTRMGYKVGLIGTCQNEIGSEILHAERTTPEADELFAIFRQMADKGCDFCVMEVSSQGLEQGRVDGLIFETAVFTNLTQDHLDVHGTMENYYQAKKILFSHCKKAVINIDSDYGMRCFNEIVCDKMSFSENSDTADISANNGVLTANGVSYDCYDGRKRFHVDFAMPGDFNISNSLGVIAAMESLSFDGEKCAEMLRGFSGVRGRAEVIETGRDFTVICDYAHTPDAVENILRAVRGGAKGRVVCLFGCGGNRDAKKRPLMAKAASEYSDFVIVTSDNPRNEDPDAIIEDVLKGMGDVPYVRITDRREAIHWAVKNAQSGDTIVLCGKGHEDYQILAGNVKIHFDEREVVKEALDALN